MRAFLSTGDPDRLVELADAPEPTPAADEALVAVAGYSLNRGEVIRLDRQGAGARPGQDVAGHVLAAAADGSGPAAGARVIAHVLAGSWAERVAAPTSALAEVRTDLPIELAAAVPMAGLTALRLLRAGAADLFGGRVLLTSAGGGVGHAFTELAARVGARTTAVSSRAGESLRQRGAAAVVATIDEAQGPFDLIVESLGGNAFARSWQLVTPAGTIIWMGQASGEAASLDFFSRVGPGINPVVRRFSYWPAPEPDAVDLETLVRLVDEGHLHPQIGACAPWEETPAVLTGYANRELTGNAVLIVA